MGELKKRYYKTEINNCFLYTSDCLSLSENCSICTHGGRKDNLVYAPITINLYFKFNIFKMKRKKNVYLQIRTSVDDFLSPTSETLYEAKLSRALKARPQKLGWPGCYYVYILNQLTDPKLIDMMTSITANKRNSGDFNFSFWGLFVFRFPTHEKHLLQIKMVQVLPALFLNFNEEKGSTVRLSSHYT